MNVLSVVVTLAGRHVQFVLAYAMAFFLYRVLRFRRGIILGNLRRAFGDAKNLSELDRIGFESTFGFMATIFEFLGSYDGTISDHVTFEGEEHLTKALAEGRGVYVLVCHMGNWEAMGSAITKQFCPSYVIVKKVGSPGLNRFVVERRAKNRFLTIERTGKGSAAEGIKRALARNEAIGFVMDQVRPNEARYPFFGHPAKTTTGFAAIWRKNQAPIISAHAERIAMGRHVVKFHPRVEIVPSDDLPADIDAFTIRFNQEVESLVRACPHQYFWMHNRWKK